MTEIRVLDTYWSDHCRHTTFSTELKDVSFDDGYYQEADSRSTYRAVSGRRTKRFFRDVTDKFVCLMDLALMAMRKLKAGGQAAGPGGIR